MKKFINLEVFFKFLSRLNKREKVIFYLAVCFVSLLSLDRLIVAPILSKLKKISKEIEEKEIAVKKDLHILSQKDRILSEEARYARFIGGVKNEEEQVTSMLKEIETLTNKSSVYLVDMKPAGFKDSGSSKKYMVNLSCEGEMEQLVDFMYNLENSNKLLTIEKYQIVPKSRESSVASCTMIVSKIVIP